MNKICVKVLKPFDGHKVGDEVTVPCDSEGTPVDRSWRRRFKDAETDECCKIISKKQRPKGKTSTGDK